MRFKLGLSDADKYERRRISIGAQQRWHKAFVFWKRMPDGTRVVCEHVQRRRIDHEYGYFWEYRL